MLQIRNFHLSTLQFNFTILISCNNVIKVRLRIVLFNLLHGPNGASGIYGGTFTRWPGTLWLGQNIYIIRTSSLVVEIILNQKISYIYYLLLRILNIEETKKIMDEDPAVKEGVFVYQILSCRSFPGDRLPEQQFLSVV